MDVGIDAEEVYSKLMKAGVIVRPMKEYGFDTHIRVTIGLPEQNKRFIGELKKIVV